MKAQPDYLPTPAEIIARCAEIRASWTPEEFRKRAMHLMGEVVTRRIPEKSIGIRTAKVSDLYGTMMQHESDTDIFLSHLPYSER